MRVAILGASGQTGRQLITQALPRGHHVTALVRDPERSELKPSPTLRLERADVTRPSTVVSALSDCDVVLSGLGVAKGGAPTTLTSGAQAVAAAVAERGGDLRVVWLGAFGVGRTADIAGPLTRLIVNLALRREIADKISADDILIPIGATVFHAGPLTNGGLSEKRRTVSVDQAPRRLFPHPISRATIAALMLDEAETRSYPHSIVIPLS